MGNKTVKQQSRNRSPVSDNNNETDDHEPVVQREAVGGRQLRKQQKTKSSNPVKDPVKWRKIPDSNTGHNNTRKQNG